MQNIHLNYIMQKYKKVEVGNDQEMAQSERNSHFKNRGVGKHLNAT